MMEQDAAKPELETHWRILMIGRGKRKLEENGPKSHDTGFLSQ